MIKVEIELVGESLAEAVIDLGKFKRVLGGNWSLERAVSESARITKLTAMTTEQFLKYMWLMLDWGKLINAFDKTKENEMVVKAYAVNYRGWPMFSPGSTNGRKFGVGVSEEEGNDVILVQSLCKGVSFNIKNFIDNNQFRYGFPPKGKKWEMDVSGLLDSSDKSLNKS